MNEKVKLLEFKPERVRHDWEALKVEWAQSGLTLNAFRELKGIENSSWFYAKVDEHKWVEYRADLVLKSQNELAKQTARVIVKDWVKHADLWEELEEVVRETFKNNREGKKKINTNELAQIANALEKALRAQRLMTDKSTSNVAHGSVHRRMVEIIKQIKAEKNDAKS